jgi:aldehyde dehydrogenase (NAD+)
MQIISSRLHCAQESFSSFCAAGAERPQHICCNSAAAPVENEMTLADETLALLGRLGVTVQTGAARALPARTPITGETLCQVAVATPEAAAAQIDAAHAAFLIWREVPAPQRGELVRLLAEEVRANKHDLGRLVSIEAGKTRSEGLGEVQEVIDICDFAVGLSRQLYGLTLATERAGHRMMETWHPAGVVGIISAFNFPVAVWSWNAAIALVCGDAVVWKPSEKTPLTALACSALLARALARYGAAPPGLAQLLVGGPEIGAVLVDHPRIAVVSATGSTRMGREIAPRIARRFARSILELGGNNASIICPSANLDLALRAVAFAAMGTAGQRCTTTRRLFVHASLYDAFVPRLRRAFASVSVGNPLDDTVLVGPLIDAAAFAGMQAALIQARDLGAEVSGGQRIDTGAPAAFYVRPALVEMSAQSGIMLEETFAPILYVMRFTSLDEVIALNNDARAGLSSSIFTQDITEAERFLSASGSDCGLANVNIGTSGAEIGGAFGGEKETGGGRESGSDAWRAYMRRATNTINYAGTFALAQGVMFDVGD